LVAFGASFLFLRREEDQRLTLGEESAPETTVPDDSREVPYGPFLGMAAGLVMLVQDYAIGYFQPGVEALWSAIVG
jgi:hypothetical protein